MLRPACLLPAARLSPRYGLSMPRLGHRDFSQCLGPATRRSGAYRDGTLTRWRSAASRRAVGRRAALLFVGVTTHHAPKVASAPRDTAPRNQERRPGSVATPTATARAVAASPPSRAPAASTASASPSRAARPPRATATTRRTTRTAPPPTAALTSARATDPASRPAARSATAPARTSATTLMPASRSRPRAAIRAAPAARSARVDRSTGHGWSCSPCVA